MYNPKSSKAQEFINDKEILDTIKYAKENGSNIELIEQILEKAEKMNGITHRESAVLLECSDKNVLEKIYSIAKK